MSFELVVDDFLSFVLLVLLGAGFGFVARRTLGAPVGWPRSIIIGMILFSSIGGVVPWVAEETGISERTTTTVTEIVAAAVVFILVFAWGFFLSVAALVVLELIIPTGSLGTPWGMISEIRQRNRRTRRYLQVLAIATRNGLGGFLGSSTSAGRSERTANSSATARALRNALNEGGVTFIKIGQMLSSRPDVIGPVFAAELSHLQAASSPIPWPQLEAVLAASQRRPLSEIFADIDSSPLAVASVAQVHTATLVTGEAVVVKIQKPKAQQQVTADLDIVRRLAKRLETSTQWGRSLGVVGMADGFATSLREELDYRIEVENTQAIAAAAGPDSELHIPRVYDELCTSNVLVLERLSGVPLGSAGDKLDAVPIEDRRILADRLLGGVLQQVMVSGIFHSDLHPGNVLLSPEGELQLLDFGSVGRLDDGAREALTMLILSIDRGASPAATDALIDLMDPPAVPIDERRLEREVGQLLVRYRGGTSSTSGMFGQLFALVNRWGFGVPPQIAAVFRTLASLEGTLRLLDPSINLVVSARRHGEALFSAQVTPTSVRAQAEAEVINLLPILRRLPRRLDKIAADLEKGELSFGVRLLGDATDRHFLSGLTHQLVVALLASATTVAAIVLLTAQNGPMFTPSIGFYQLLGFGLLFVGSVLALRALVLVFRHSHWT
jgi:ubiquinone biosynthesis protein